MKKPRLEDFDPNAAPPLGSPMDNYPPIEKPHRSIAPSGPQENPPISATVLPPERPEQSLSPLSPSEPMNHPFHEPAGSSSQDQANKRTKELSFERTKEIKNERM